jgi:chromosome condensin MukBEF ATPase and DNA-binding subunit MukB
MTPEERDRLARLEVEMTLVKETLGDIRRDTREVRDAVLNAKGGWRTLAVLGGVSAAIGGVIAKFASWLQIQT